MMHKHVLAAGWIRGRQTFRECVECRQVFRWYGANKKPDIVKTDYSFYTQMAEYWCGNGST
jgi:hypothetical protein